MAEGQNADVVKIKAERAERAALKAAGKWPPPQAAKPKKQAAKPKPKKQKK